MFCDVQGVKKDTLTKQKVLFCSPHLSRNPSCAASSIEAQLFWLGIPFSRRGFAWPRCLEKKVPKTFSQMAWLMVMNPMVRSVKNHLDKTNPSRPERKSLLQAQHTPFISPVITHLVTIVNIFLGHPTVYWSFLDPKNKEILRNRNLKLNSVFRDKLLVLGMASTKKNHNPFAHPPN